jgi:ABC-type microcin C transport system permease subunit YejB
MLKNYAQLDFGNSFFRGATVTDLILQKCRCPFPSDCGRH